MSNKSFLSIFDQFNQELTPYGKAYVGMDAVLDNLKRVHQMTSDNYPPFNIEKTGDYTYRITLALAGFTKDSIEVSQEGDILTIKSIDEENTDTGGRTFLHRGIAARKFIKTVQLAENINVESVVMQDGLLHIDLLKVVPITAKRKVFEVK